MLGFSSANRTTVCMELLKADVFYFLASAAALLGIYLIWFVRKSGPSLPPGPKGFPILGNLNNLPRWDMMEAHHWLKHEILYGLLHLLCFTLDMQRQVITQRTLGPISSVTTMGKTIIIINDFKLALELLNENSIKTAFRPRSVISGDMYG